MSKHKRLKGLLVLCSMLSLLAGTALAQTVPQGYQSDEPLQKGMIVRLSPKDGRHVQAVTQQDAAEILGVVVSSTEAAVSLSHTDVDKEVFIANNGQYDVLVSTQNGPIKTGDYIAVSSLGGVGMKAAAKQQFVLGKALQGFDGKSASEGSTTLKTSDGDAVVSLGRIGIELSVAHNPYYQKDPPPGVPDFLARAVDVVTDRPVGAVRIYAGLAVAVLSIIIAGSVLYAGVRSGMLAIGRNPLAKKSIMRNLIQVTIMALIVFVIGAIAVYLLLRV